MAECAFRCVAQGLSKLRNRNLIFAECVFRKTHAPYRQIRYSYGDPGKIRTSDLRFRKPFCGTLAWSSTASSKCVSSFRLFNLLKLYRMYTDARVRTVFGNKVSPKVSPAKFLLIINPRVACGGMAEIPEALRHCRRSLRLFWLFPALRARVTIFRATSLRLRRQSHHTLRWALLESLLRLIETSLHSVAQRCTRASLREQHLTEVPARDTLRSTGLEWRTETLSKSD